MGYVEYLWWFVCWYICLSLNVTLLDYIFGFGIYMNLLNNVPDQIIKCVFNKW